MTSNATPTSITPACLYSLAIYNPSLGTTDETLPDQIVFWNSRTPSSQNDSLNQIGLAQGIVEFARGFSKAQDLSSVDTQKSRIVILEPEPGWWILAYIDLTRIHYDNADPPTIDYSPREVAPATVLLAQLRNSYNQFVFANGTFEQIYTEYGRLSLSARLNKYYTKWAWQWDVMLSGNPAVDIWSGIRIGHGVGNQEKEVLRGFVDRNRKKPHVQGGLIDMVVSRFKIFDGSEMDATQDFNNKGSGKLPGIGDGCIYRGNGNLTAETVRDVTDWTAHWVQHGDSLFKLSSRPTRRKRRTPRAESKVVESSQSLNDTSGGVNNNSTRTTVASSSAAKQETINSISKTRQSDGSPSRMTTRSESGENPQKPAESLANASEPTKGTIIIDASTVDKSQTTSAQQNDPDERSTSTGLNTGKLVMGVLTLGTYSAWDYYHNSASKPATPEPSSQTDTEDVDPIIRGKFVIGYAGDLEDEDEQEISDIVDSSNTDDRISKKTVWIDTKDLSTPDTKAEAEDDLEEMRPPLQECRLVVYINYPLVFALLFKSDHHELNKPSFYRALHYQLGPLRDPLVASCDSFPQPSGTKGTYDLIFDPDTLSVHTSLPNIPEPLPPPKATSGDLPRMDALHIHTQLVKLVEDTRQKGVIHSILPGERERTSHTSRGWWIGWMRLEGVVNSSDAIIDTNKRESSLNDDDIAAKDPEVVNDTADAKSIVSHRSSSSLRQDTISTMSIHPSTSRREAFIIRKSSDHSRTHSRQASKDKDMNSSRITEGLGVDPRKYFEQLLNFNART